MPLKCLCIDSVTLSISIFCEVGGVAMCSSTYPRAADRHARKERTGCDWGLWYRISFCCSDVIKLRVWLLTEQVHFLFPGTLGQVFHGPLAWSNLLEENILRLNLSLWLPRLEPLDGSLNTPPHLTPVFPISISDRTLKIHPIVCQEKESGYCHPMFWPQDVTWIRLCPI